MYVSALPGILFLASFLCCLTPKFGNAELGECGVSKICRLRSCQCRETSVSCQHAHATIAVRGIQVSTCVTRLSVTKSGLQVISARTLHGSPQVRHLNLSRNRISELQDGCMAALPHLKTLDLSHNRLRARQIRLSVFADVGSSLTHLNLADNRLARLQSTAHVFQALPKLTELQISGNRIQTLTGAFRKTQPQLHRLTAARNHIDAITPIAFVHVSATLTHLDLSDNPLTVAHPLSFLDMTSLQSLALSGIPLNVTLPSLRHLSTNTLTTLHLSRASITHLSPHLCNLLFSQLEFRTLQVLHIARNHIADIPANCFGALRQLRELDVSGNRLVTIAMPLPLPVTPISTATSPPNTHITYSKYPNITGIHKLALTLDAANNPFDCNCKLQQDIQTLQANNVTLKQFPAEYLCHRPSDSRSETIAITLDHQFVAMCGDAGEEAGGPMAVLTVAITGVIIFTGIFIFYVTQEYHDCGCCGDSGYVRPRSHSTVLRHWDLDHTDKNRIRPHAYSIV